MVPTRKVRKRRRPGSPKFLTAALVLVAVSASQVAAKGTSPHWKADACEACHASAAPTPDQLALKSTPASAGCTECHDGGDASLCRHRSDIVVSAERASGFDSALQAGVQDGLVACTTCHEMRPHCERDVKQKYRNKSFLRGGPFEARADQCFNCHKSSDYKQRSPHRQVKRKKVMEGSCQFCHGVVPQQDASGQWMSVEFVNGGPQSQLCTGCHIVGPHPSGSIGGKRGWFHMSVPTQKQLDQMQRTTASLGGRLPLDPVGGNLTCGTCHDPHDKKLEGMSVAAAPGTKAKLRFEDMCGACHDN